ncbi:hypothetical protein [Rhodovulum sulfidophilum]|nr:hypothetical protein [Rhodovulum sulfidophilum]
MDILAFYFLPALFGFSLFWFCVGLGDEVFGVSISVFSIFSALLFSAQVAMYGVFRADRKFSQDPITQAGEKDRLEEVRVLLREINTNISYLILVSFSSVTIFLALYVLDLPERLESAILGFLYLHFLLTLLMVIKRSHEVFDSEYAKPPD